MTLRKLGIFFLSLHALTGVFSLVGTWALYNLANVPDWDYVGLTFWIGVANILTGVLTAFLLMAYHEGWRSAWTLLVNGVGLRDGPRRDHRVCLLAVAERGRFLRDAFAELAWVVVDRHTGGGCFLEATAKAAFLAYRHQPAWHIAATK